jgi:3-oxoacyl-[acyl-carrier-protein] synthase II
MRPRPCADDDVVVTGMGAVSALGTGCAAHAEALRAGRDGLRPLARFDVRPFGGAVAGTWPGWDGRVQAEAASEEELRAGARGFAIEEMATAAAREAWQQARLEERHGRRTALVLGTCFGQAFSLFSEMTEAVAAALAVGGPALTLSTACSSSTNAVGLGRDLLRAGRADVVLAGGADALLREVLAGFNALGVVSREKCAPFSEPAGINLGEGAGVVVLERAADARARGAVALAAIHGYGLSADAHHETTPDPSGRGLERAIRWALADAGVAADEIDHVNAHATGTESNDRTEWQAIARALGSRACPVPVSGLKSFLGHAQGAAGVLELILGLLAMREGVLPPTLRFTRPRPGAPPDPVPGPRPRPARVRCALDVSAAFGGANAVLVYGEPEAANDTEAPPALPTQAAGAPSGAAPVIVRGLGLVAPLGMDIEALAQAIAAGRPVAGPVPPVDLGAVVPTADPRGSDPSTLFVTAAVAGALREAGIAPRGTRRDDTGLFLAATRMPHESARRCHQSLRDHGTAGMSAAAFARMSVNAPAGACAKHLGLRGPSTTLSIGAGSGLAAVAYAADWLARRQDAERLAVAAVDEGSAFEGAACALLERAPSVAGPDAGDDQDAVAVAGWAMAGAGEIGRAARDALGDHPCPDGIWGEGEAARAALAPRVADAAALPLGFLDVGALLPAGEACLSALALLLAAHALRRRRARSLLVLAAAGRAASVAVLLRRTRP